MVCRKPPAVKKKLNTAISKRMPQSINRTRFGVKSATLQTMKPPAHQQAMLECGHELPAVVTVTKG